jgi:hypothetical protein
MKEEDRKMKVTSLRGNVYHIPKDSIAAILLEAGICTEFIEAAKPLNPAVWTAGTDFFSRQPYIEVKRGAERMRYLGPRAADQKFGHESCPADVAEKYKQLLKGYRPAKRKNDDEL